MSVDRTGTPHAVSTLLEAVDKQKLGIPEFQRDFVWSPSQVAELLRTVARDWPCGTFLMQEGPQDLYACRAIEGAPSLRRAPTLIILDGQQRITALYHALRERGSEIYYVDLRAGMQAGELEDEHVAFKKAERYRKLYPDLAAEALAGVARVGTLARDEEFFKWVGCLDESERQNAIRFRATQLQGFKHYSIPCVVLLDDTPLQAVAKIFETINRTGIELDAFDLMVAKLHPRKFFLRDKNKQAVAEFPALDQYGVAGIELLRSVALREHVRQAESRAKPVTVKGVRRSDVIDLPAEIVQADWEPVVRDTAHALEFLSKECGVVAPALLPSKSMLLPIAAVISEVKSKRHRAILRKWFWHSSFAQTHAQGANTRVVTDAKQLRAALAAGVLDMPQESDASAAEIIGESRTRNEILLRGLACALAWRGALEPRLELPLADVQDELDVVPLFSPRCAASLGVSDAHAIANYIVVSVGTKRLMGNHPPSALVTKKVLTRKGLESQQVPWAAITRDDWDRFYKARSSALLDVRGEVESPGAE